MDVHLAQINVGTLLAPIDDPRVAEFADNLDRINAIADAAPGFVWRLQDDDGNATSIQAFDDPRTIVNMSVWATVEQFREFVFRTDHATFLRRRAEWFDTGAKRVALWWAPVGTIPTLSDGVRRVEFLERHGPSPYAFGLGSVGDRLVLRRTVMEEAATRELIERLDVELIDMYADPNANHLTLDPRAVTGSGGAMVLAELNGRAVACGAIRRIDEHSAEVKRMYVDPTVRGSKIGAAVLDRLESEAVDLGFRELRLETGTLQDAAIGMYERAGFTRTELWGEYVRSPDTSICFRKPLPG